MAPQGVQFQPNPKHNLGNGSGPKFWKFLQATEPHQHRAMHSVQHPAPCCLFPQGSPPAASHFATPGGDSQP